MLLMLPPEENYISIYATDSPIYNGWGVYNNGWESMDSITDWEYNYTGKYIYPPATYPYGPHIGNLQGIMIYIISDDGNNIIERIYPKLEPGEEKTTEKYQSLPSRTNKINVSFIYSISNEARGHRIAIKFNYDVPKRTMVIGRTDNLLYNYYAFSFELSSKGIEVLTVTITESQTSKIYSWGDIYFPLINWQDLCNIEQTTASARKLVHYDNNTPSDWGDGTWTDKIYDINKIWWRFKLKKFLSQDYVELKQCLRAADIQLDSGRSEGWTPEDPY